MAQTGKTFVQSSEAKVRQLNKSSLAVGVIGIVLCILFGVAGYLMIGIILAVFAGIAILILKQRAALLRAGLFEEQTRKGNAERPPNE
ncbi:hypothetical protein [Cohnella sp. REN36]|uniref:hypothetical protein n=1 Tax=Cohnella sp. REN36 TaxID=2887347 RepID=UPI001D13EA84|nr:hypothetical protein [Cohnella sp. REN36]MCC3375915.1 hypothetical protein [Cohnella sp. REN36]